MTERKLRSIATAVALSLAALVLLTTVVSAQTQKVEGIIKGRSGNTMTLQTSDTPKLVVVLADSTDVGQVVGALKARSKKCPWPPSFPVFPFRSKEP